MKTTWMLRDATNRFSEVVERALHDGPQTMTRRGKEKDVLISAETFRAWSGQERSLADFLRRSPLHGVKLDLNRRRHIDGGKHPAKAGTTNGSPRAILFGERFAAFGQKQASRRHRVRTCGTGKKAHFRHVESPTSPWSVTELAGQGGADTNDSPHPKATPCCRRGLVA
jgi:antitoxin Phd